jgi:hypothetical protein
MSMHEIEDAIEASVRVIDRADLAPTLTRDIIWNLYDYQACFDTGLTTGRVRDILRRWRYLVPPGLRLLDIRSSVHRPHQAGH